MERTIDKGKLAGQVAIITGAGRGIGRAEAISLSGEGAKVIVSDIDFGAATSVANEIKDMGGQALPIKADVTNTNEVNQMVDAALKGWGQIDILVNNAGGGAREKARPFYEVPDELWRSVVDRNLYGTLACTRAVISHMVERRSGKIINTSSVAAFRPCTGLVEYAAAKWGVIGFTKMLACEVGSFGIRVNCVTPGPIQSVPGLLEIAIAQPYVKAVVLGRMGETQDIANAVLFLVSDESSFITGANLEVSGGSTI